MPNFLERDNAPARILHDFVLEAAAGYNPTEDDEAAVVAIKQVLDELVSGLVADSDARTRLRSDLRAARAAWREEKVFNLRDVAALFASGTINARQAAERAKSLAEDIKQSVPDVAITAATSPRFGGEFSVIATAFAFDAAAQVYVDRQGRLIDNLADDEIADSGAQFSLASLERRRSHRKDAIDRLRQNFIIWKEGASSEIAAANVSYVRGRYAAERDQLKQKLFTVKAASGADADLGYNVGVNVKLFDGLPPPNDAPTRDQQDLYVEIGKAETVIATVCRQIRARAHRRIFKQPAEEKRGLRLLGEYVDKLVGIGLLGLEDGRTDFAKMALVNLREEFVAREAAEILNRYARRLGLWAGGFAFVFLIIYAYVRNSTCTDPNVACDSWWNLHKTFLLAATGASLGTWASFSVRRINLTFDQLATPEEQLLDAPFRIVFVVVLTMAACLLFWTGAINVKIGDLNTESVWFSKLGAVAVLVGFFCGLSERALASAIAGRASAFVGGIAGSK